mmetsp:Transcript_4083/g.10318  ORF Transcript_4083/g.10318 Transcript_4083/m.10318 type:complete len:704 (-) Transcript_4083:104-2215(-)
MGAAGVEAQGHAPEGRPLLLQNKRTRREQLASGVPAVRRPRHASVRLPRPRLLLVDELPAHGLIGRLGARHEGGVLGEVAVVRQRLHRRAEVRVGRGAEKVGHARGVDVGVLFDLVAEQALVVDAGAREKAPALVEVRAVGLDHGRDGAVQRLQVQHQLPQRLVHARLVAQQLRHLAQRRLAGHLALPLRAHRVENLPQQLLLLQQLLHLGAVRPPHAERRHLLLQLADDERRAPAEVGLGERGVGVDVVAHVQHVAADHAKRVLHRRRGAAAEDAAHRGVRHRLHQPVVRHDLVHRLSDLEKRGLVGLHDDHAEEVAPGHAGGKEAVKRVLHHRLRVLKVAVGDQHQLLARVALVQQRGGRLGVQLHKALRVLQDLLLQLALHDGAGLRLGHQIVQRHVGAANNVLGQVARVEAVHELAEQHGLADGEQRVDELPAAGVRVLDQLAPVGFVHLARVEHARAVHRALHEAKAVHLDQVAQLFVQDQPADGQLWLELEALHGAADAAEVVQAVLEGQPLPLVDVVVDERVVHVVADGLDGAQVERAVAEDGPVGHALGAGGADAHLLQQRLALLLHLLQRHVQHAIRVLQPQQHLLHPVGRHAHLHAEVAARRLAQGVHIQAGAHLEWVARVREALWQRIDGQLALALLARALPLLAACAVTAARGAAVLAANPHAHRPAWEFAAKCMRPCQSIARRPGRIALN